MPSWLDIMNEVQFIFPIVATNVAGAARSSAVQAVDAFQSAAPSANCTQTLL
jgi:hypothetical protein